MTYGNPMRLLHPFGVRNDIISVNQQFGGINEQEKTRDKKTTDKEEIFKTAQKKKNSGKSGKSRTAKIRDSKIRDSSTTRRIKVFSIAFPSNRRLCQTESFL